MRSALLLAVMLLVLNSCASVPALNTGTGDLPPVLSLEDLNRPYSKVGRIHVTRTVYGTDYALSANLHEWGLDALRLEARKMDADAVIFPEISSKESTVFLLPVFPATEFKATGVAIKFGR